MEPKTDPAAGNLPLSPDAGGGRGEIDALLPKIYDELHTIAARMMSRERDSHTLQATALVHEAYVRLIDHRNVLVDDKNKFFAAAANVIRRVLVDHARGRDAAKRGGAWERLTLAAADVPGDESAIDLLDLNDAMTKLSELNSRAAQVVEMRYFGGLNVDEVAAAIGVSARTVADDWSFARAWLRREMSAERDDG